jgi:hypothetical protein
MIIKMPPSTYFTCQTSWASKNYDWQSGTPGTLIYGDIYSSRFLKQLADGRWVGTTLAATTNEIYMTQIPAGTFDP